MEEYVNKVNYLRHLKKIAQIRGGSHKSTITSNNLSKSSIISDNIGTKDALTSPKTAVLLERCQSRNHTSTERIVRNFLVEKQNHRLLGKIMNMSSSIPFKKYEKQYQQSKNYPFKENRIKRKQKYIVFKLFDISMSLGRASSPDDFYKVFCVENRKKTLLAKDTLFELRRSELKVRRSEEVMLKIEGKEEEGIVKLSHNNLMDIIRHGHKIGHIVVEFIKK